VVKLLATALLELIPVEAILIVLTGYNGLNILQTPVPFWFILSTLLLAWAIGRYMAGANWQRLAVVSLPFLILAALLLIRISPAAYGSSGSSFFDWSWLLTFGQDIVNQAPQVTSIALLLLLLAYIWWRGLRLGSDPPDHSSVVNRFKLGMIALVAVTILSAAIPSGVVQEQVIAFLGLLLTLEVFTGLIASSLSRLEQNQLAQRGDAYLATNNQLWLGTAFALASVSVGFALLINLIINYQSVGSLLMLLGPVGTAVNDIVAILVDGLAQLLHFLLGWLFALFKPAASHSTISLPQSPLAGKGTRHKAPQIPHIWVQVSETLLEVGAVIAVIFLFLWLLRKVVVSRRPPVDILDEERESLDGVSIFGEQMRAFLASLRRSREEDAIDPLTPGSVRYLYREFLEAASRRGLTKEAAETPDEYGARLRALPRLAESGSWGIDDLEALDILSEAYNTTRYAERPPADQDMPRIRQLAKSLSERLRR
jgi:hypothetical protein